MDRSRLHRAERPRSSASPSWKKLTTRPTRASKPRRHNLGSSGQATRAPAPGRPHPATAGHQGEPDVGKRSAQLDAVDLIKVQAELRAALDAPSRGPPRRRRTRPTLDVEAKIKADPERPRSSSDASTEVEGRDRYTRTTASTRRSRRGWPPSRQLDAEATRWKAQGRAARRVRAAAITRKAATETN